MNLKIKPSDTINLIILKFQILVNLTTANSQIDQYDFLVIFITKMNCVRYEN